jgi:hypothetical protein
MSSKSISPAGEQNMHGILTRQQLQSGIEAKQVAIEIFSKAAQRMILAGYLRLQRGRRAPTQVAR